MRGGAFLWSLSSRPDLEKPPACTVLRDVGATPNKLLERHLSELRLLPVGRVVSVDSTDALRASTERHHAVVHDFHLGRGVFAPLTPEQGCANHIRSSVEELLTAQRVPQTNGRTVATGRKHRRLTLAERIRIFRDKQPELAEALDAIRWLGNAGSHADRITTDDLLDGFEIIEHVLDMLYSRRGRRVGAITRAINRRKGPRSRRRGEAK